MPKRLRRGKKKRIRWSSHSMGFHGPKNIYIPIYGHGLMAIQKIWLYGYMAIYIYVCIHLYIYICSILIHLALYIYIIYIIYGWMYSIHLTYNHGTTVDRSADGPLHRQPIDRSLDIRSNHCSAASASPACEVKNMMDILCLWSICNISILYIYI